MTELEIIELQVITLMAVALIAAVFSPRWKGTAITMLCLAIFNWSITDLLDMKSFENPWILGLFNFISGILVLTWGSKSTKTLERFTQCIAAMFVVAMLVEIGELIDIEKDTDIVYPNYHLMIIVLNAAQIMYLIWGIPYGRVHSKSTDAWGTRTHSVGESP